MANFKVVDFRAGGQQARIAGRYFTTLASNLVDEVIAEMKPYQYRFEPKGQESLAMRLWCNSEPSDESVVRMLPVISSTEHLFKQLPGIKGDDISDFLNEIPWETDFNLFIEVLENHRAFTKKERVRLSLCFTTGHIRVISTPPVLFVKQDEPDLFGLAIGGKGSYLIERVQVRPVTTRR